MTAVLDTEEMTAAEVQAALPAPCVGYAYGADGAWWFRVTQDGLEHAPSAPTDRDPHEIVAFDGTQVMRWRRSSGAVGTRLVEAVPEEGLRFQTLLAGHVEGERDGWVTLEGRRKTRFDVPLTAAPGQAVVLEQIEEVAVDSHGNARVVATHPVRLTAVDDPAEVE